MNQFYEAAKQFAIRLEEKENAVPVTFICYLRHRDSDAKEEEQWLELVYVFEDWPPDDKHTFMVKLGEKITRQNPRYMLVMVVQLSEAWTAMYKPDKVANGGRHMAAGVPPPSKRSDRLEVLLVDACTVDQRQSSYSVAIIRTSSGKFGTWGQATEHRYGDGGDDHNRTNHLTLSIFMGSTSLAAARNKTEE